MIFCLLNYKDMNFNYSKVFPDLMSVTSGVMLLLFLALYYNYNLKNLEYFSNFSLIYENESLILLIFISTAYFIGNILFGIGYAWMKILHFLYEEVFKRLFPKIKLQKSKNKILHMLTEGDSDEKLSKMIGKSEILKNEYYRRDNSVFFIDFLLGETFVIGIIIIENPLVKSIATSKYCLVIIFILLTFANIFLIIRRNETEKILRKSNENKISFPIK